jgi:hypothetical protein
MCHHYSQYYSLPAKIFQFYLSITYTVTTHRTVGFVRLEFTVTYRNAYNSLMSQDLQL